MKYLKSFWITLRGSLSKLVGVSSKKIKKNDLIGRFLTSSGHFSKTKGRVKYNALMPKFIEQSSTYETSVFKIQNLTNRETKQLASKYILQHLPNGRSIYGNAEFKRMNIDDSDLKLSLSEPPPNHCNIIGWPDEKSERMLKAKELARKANLVLFTNKLKA